MQGNALSCRYLCGIHRKVRLHFGSLGYNDVICRGRATSVSGVGYCRYSVCAGRSKGYRRRQDAGILDAGCLGSPHDAVHGCAVGRAERSRNSGIDGTLGLIDADGGVASDSTQFSHISDNHIVATLDCRVMTSHTVVNQRFVLLTGNEVSLDIGHESLRHNATRELHVHTLLEFLGRARSIPDAYLVVHGILLGTDTR